MSNDNKELKNADLNNNESCEGKKELSMEELEQVTGGDGGQRQALWGVSVCDLVTQPCDPILE